MCCATHAPPNSGSASAAATRLICPITSTRCTPRRTQRLPLTTQSPAAPSARSSTRLISHLKPRGTGTRFTLRPASLTVCATMRSTFPTCRCVATASLIQIFNFFFTLADAFDFQGKEHIQVSSLCLSPCLIPCDLLTITGAPPLSPAYCTPHPQQTPAPSTPRLSLLSPLACIRASPARPG